MVSDSNIKLKDPEIILLCAFRYALGRKTYMVSKVVSELLNNWENFSYERRDQIKGEIIEYKRVFGNLGHDSDEEQWNRILVQSLDTKINDILENPS